jgi:hypothetical protein
MNTTSNALTVTDGFSDTDPSASPVRGTSTRFVDRVYIGLGGDKFETKNKSFAVLDRRQGWQKSEKDCPAEYLMRAVGQPKPQQPFVDKKTGRWISTSNLLTRGNGPNTFIWSTLTRVNS